MSLFDDWNDGTDDLFDEEDLSIDFAEIMDEDSRRRVGQRLRVLCTGSEGGYRTGRSYADSPEVDGTVYFEGDCLPGEFAEVRITGVMDGDLVGTAEP